MSNLNAEEVCRQKSDEELRRASGVLHEYTDAFRKAILAELARRSQHVDTGCDESAAEFTDEDTGEDTDCAQEFQCENPDETEAPGRPKATRQLATLSSKPLGTTENGSHTTNRSTARRLTPMIAIGGFLVALGIALIALAPGPSAVTFHFSEGGVSGYDQALDTSDHKNAIAGGVILMIIGLGLAAAGSTRSKPSSTSANSSLVDTATGSSSIEDRLRKLDQIYKKHLISEEEYKEARAGLLRQI